MTGEPEWTEWGGGECPVPPDTVVMVRFRGGGEGKWRADRYPWYHWGAFHDIIAYRIVKAAPSTAALTTSAIKVTTTKSAELTLAQVADAIRAYVGAGDGSKVIVSGDGCACVTWTVESTMTEEIKA